MGEGRWAVGRDVQLLTDNTRASSLTVEVDELEAQVIILERAVAALPSAAEEEHVFKPWNAHDDAVMNLLGVMGGKLWLTAHVGNVAGVCCTVS